ncbi:MAG: hypothetical protein JWN76_1978 [Chitinophagaceae bacterium]|nr:hypothetical protein [Chitinophagaceae bacterium]
MILPFLYVAPSEKGGRGIFTSQRIGANTVIEMSPVIVLSSKDRTHIEETRLHDYIFEWGEKHKKCCVALGYVSLYNHDYSSNCDYDMDFEQETMSIRTVRPIEKGEELCVNYNADPNDKTLVWFDPRNRKQKK